MSRMPNRPKATEQTLDPETSSHIPVRQLYTPADLNAWNEQQKLGYPG